MKIISVLKITYKSNIAISHICHIDLLINEYIFIDIIDIRIYIY